MIKLSEHFLKTASILTVKQKIYVAEERVFYTYWLQSSENGLQNSDFTLSLYAKYSYGCKREHHWSKTLDTHEDIFFKFQYSDVKWNYVTSNVARSSVTTAGQENEKRGIVASIYGLLTYEAL